MLTFNFFTPYFGEFSCHDVDVALLLFKCFDSVEMVVMKGDEEGGMIVDEFVKVEGRPV